MPQPPLDIPKYLSTALPHVREQFPLGTGGTGPRAEWPEGSLKGVQLIEGFEKSVNEYFSSQVPKEPITPHPTFKYPMFVQALTKVPNVIKSPSDLQTCLSTLPLAAVSSVLTALDADPEDIGAASEGARGLDKAGYESDGGDDVVYPKPSSTDKTKAWYWQFSKSPMGNGEFLLLRKGSSKVYLVVRTLSSPAFTADDWNEFTVTGPYQYNTKSRASWYWSRTWGACKRLNCKYWVLTDWQRWTYGTFDDGLTQGFVSPLFTYDAAEPSMLMTLFYWGRSAIGAEGGFEPVKKDVSNLPAIFPSNPARRSSVSGRKPTVPSNNKPRAANESDIEESDAENADGA